MRYLRGKRNTMFQRKILALRNICPIKDRRCIVRSCVRRASNWKDLINGSEVLHSFKREVKHDAMLLLRSACHTIIRSKYREEDPNVKEATVTLYGKPGKGTDIKQLQKVIDNVNNFRNIVRYKDEGWPELLIVKFPYLQKYREELKNCTAIVVEIPYNFNIFAQVFENANLLIQEFENNKLWAYADLGEIELSKIKCIYADCYSGGDVVCRDHYHGSGTFKTMLGGNVIFKKMQGKNFSVYAEDGYLHTDAVYCEDMVYCAEQGDVTAGNIHATGCFFESYTGNIKIDSLTSDDTYGRIWQSGNLDVVLEKSSKLHLETEKGDVILRVSPSVEGDVVIHSKKSTISSELGFNKLEKRSDPVKRYDVVEGKLGMGDKNILLEAPKGHVYIKKGDWMSSLLPKVSK